jgi:biotin transport system substrate-specific component
MLGLARLPRMNTLATALRPTWTLANRYTSRRTRAASGAYEIVLVLACSGLIALSAQVAVPLPFSPVPVSGQTLAVLLIGMALGKRLGSAAVLAYLAEGSMGLPFFAGGLGGPAAIVGPTGGYLVGFLPAAWICGALAERGWDRHALRALVPLLAGEVALFSMGLFWLSRFTGPESVWALGLLPFLPGEAAKIVIAAAALPLTWRMLARHR